MGVFIYVSCSHTSKDINHNVYVHQVPSKNDINEALGVIINELDREKIFSKKDMLETIQHNKFKKNHEDCKSKKHKLQIIFVHGEWSEKKKRFCIYSNTSYLKGQCLSGLFDGEHTITMINDKKNNKIYSTSFAHEVLHYFQRYIGGMPARFHNPPRLWENLVGYKVKNKIGSINEALREKNL